MVAQAVEQWHSVRAGQVQILGWPWLCFGSDCPSILAGRWAFSINEVLDHTMRDTSILLSCFLSSVSIIVSQSINCNQCTKREINPKRARQRPILKNTFKLPTYTNICRWVWALTLILLSIEFREVPFQRASKVQGSNSEAVSAQLVRKIYNLETSGWKNLQKVHKYKLFFICNVLG